MKTFYKDKIITVTGGSSGMGKELVRQLVTAGATVVIGARSLSPAEQLITELKAAGGQVEFRALDIQQAEQCEAFFAGVLAQYGRVDYAFNCAGIIMGGEIRDHDVADVRNLLTTNVLGTSYCALYAYRIMTGQGFGHIINFASGAGLFPLPLMGVYGASKFAIFGLSEALRIEGRLLGVKVSAVAPGLVDTPIYDTAVYSKTSKSTSLRLVRHRLYMIPADKAAAKILRGTRRNQAMIGTQFYVRTTWLSYRLIPWAYRAIVGLLLPSFRKHIRKNSASTTHTSPQ